MKIKKFQLRGNSSVYAGAFQLLRGRAPAHLRGNIAYKQIFASTDDVSMHFHVYSTENLISLSEKILEALVSLCQKEEGKVT
jgi:hypothetical protein